MEYQLLAKCNSKLLCSYLTRLLVTVSTAAQRFTIPLAVSLSAIYSNPEGCLPTTTA